MTSKVSVDWRGEEFGRDFRRIAAEALDAAALAVVEKIKRSLRQRGGPPSTGPEPSPAGQPPGAVSGNLSRSIGYERSGDLSRTIGMSGVGGAHIYGALHEFGGTVTSGGKLMPVPLNREARKLLARAANVGGLRVAAPELIVFTSKRGNKILARPKGRGKHGGVEPLFVLKRSINVPARPFLRPGLINSRTEVMDAAERVIKRRMGA